MKVGDLLYNNTLRVVSIEIVNIGTGYRVIGTERV